MKQPALVCLCSLLTVLAGAVPGFGGGLNAEVSEGDTLAQVIDALGEPDGRMAGGNTEILYYERGKVELQDDRVIAANLVSQREVDERKAARIKAEQEQQRLAEQAKQRRIKDGSAELKRVSADETFAASPPANQVAYWQSFKKKYPEVSVNRQLADAQAQVRAQQAEQQQAMAEKAAYERAVPPINLTGRRRKLWERSQNYRDSMNAKYRPPTEESQ